MGKAKVVLVNLVEPDGSQDFEFICGNCGAILEEEANIEQCDRCSQKLDWTY